MTSDKRRTSFKKPLSRSEELFHGFNFNEESSKQLEKHYLTRRCSSIPHIVATPDDLTLPVPKHNDFIRPPIEADNKSTALTASIIIKPRKDSRNTASFILSNEMGVAPENSSAPRLASSHQTDSLNSTNAEKKLNDNVQSTSEVSIQSSPAIYNQDAETKSNLTGLSAPELSSLLNKGEDNKRLTKLFDKELPPLPTTTLLDLSSLDYSDELRAIADSLKTRSSRALDNNNNKPGQTSATADKPSQKTMSNETDLLSELSISGNDKEMHFSTNSLDTSPEINSKTSSQDMKNYSLADNKKTITKSQDTISNSVSSLSSGLTHYSSKTQSSCRTSDSAGEYRHSRDETILSPSIFADKNFDKKTIASYGTKDDISGTDLSSKTTSVCESNEQARIRRRYYLIRELVETERAFAADLSVVLNVYAKRLNNKEFAGFVCIEDTEKLFSNAGEIFALSRQFVQTLRHIINPYVFDCIQAKKDVPIEDVYTRIGEAFLPYLAEMGQAFETYCKQNQSQMSTFVKIKTLAPPSVDTWLWQCFQDSKDLTSAGTLDSLLIKPVQRLLKYPLLLGSLLTNTLEDHPDYPALQEAVKQLHQCTDRINAQTGNDKYTQEPLNGNSSVRSLKVVQSGASDNYLRLVNDSSADERLEDKVDEFFSRKSHLEKLMVAFRENARTIQKHFDINGRLAETWLDFFVLYDGESTRNVSNTSKKKYKKYAMTSSTFTSSAPTKSSLSAVKIATKLERGVLTPIAKVHAMYERTLAIINDRKRFHASYAKYIASKKSVDGGNPNVYHTPSEPRRNLQQISAMEIQRADLFVKYHNHLIDELDHLFEASEIVIGLAMSKYVAVQKRWFRLALDYMSSVLSLRLEDIKDPNGQSNPIIRQFLKEQFDMKEQIQASGLNEFSLAKTRV